MISGCNKCPCKRLCHDIEFENLSYEDIKNIAEQGKRGEEMNKKNCPVCDYLFNMCQCGFGGNAHPDRSKRARVVADHIYLLSDEQIGHLKQIQKWWSIVYDDEEMNQILEELESEVKE